MESDMKCPCEKCLMIPVCRHKMFLDLLETCHIFHKYTTLHSHAYTDRILYNQVIEKILKPTTWTVDENGYITRKVIKVIYQ